MKGGRDEGGEKIMGPMFPRLHVNDTTEKGGPRAPPRNKMAIYEQLSIPAQRFHSNTTTFPLPPHNTATLVPSASSSQGGGHVRSVFSPFYVPPAPAYSTEKGNSRYSDGMKINSGFSESERKSTKNSSYKTSNTTGHLSSTAEFSSARPIEISKSNNSFGKKSGDEDDFRVPTFGNSGTGLSPKDQHGTNRERLTPFYPTYPDNSTITKANRPQKSAAATCNSSAQLQNAHDKPMKRPNTTELKSRHSLHHITENGKNSGEQKHKATVEIRDCVEKLPCRSAMGEKIAEPSKYAEKLLNQEHSRGPINGLENPNGESNRFYTEYSVGLPAEDNSYGGRISVVPRHLNVAEVRENANILGARSEMSSRVLHGNRNEIANRADNCCDESGEKVCRSLQRRDKDRNDDVSDTSMVDFISGQDISPDDVVEVIGQKHFWEARRAIVNQQRVFAVQVFELHRLIKVQKLIAGSPHLLLEDNPFFTPPSLKVSTKKLSSEFAMKSQPQSVKQQDESRKPTQNSHSSTENAIEKVPIPSYDNGVNNGLVSHISSSGPYPGNVPPTMMAADSKTSPWCFQPPGNQWLVPVMSPSEGFIYKPYHPTAGFMAPVYGACGPLNLPPVTGDFMNPAYCVPASHPQQGVGILSGTPALPHSYFTPYGLSAVNPMIPGTINVAAPVAELGNPSPGIQSNGQAEQFSMGEINYNMHPSRLCNMKSSCQVRQVQSSKDSEFQGSTVSSACEREPGGARQTSEGSDALPLFPLAPAMEALDQNSSQGEQPGRVIKVVPHNPRSATESAARIFRSIQEERQQFDS